MKDLEKIVRHCAFGTAGIAMELCRPDLRTSPDLCTVCMGSCVQSAIIEVQMLSASCVGEASELLSGREAWKIASQP